MKNSKFFLFFEVGVNRMSVWPTTSHGAKQRCSRTKRTGKGPVKNHYDLCGSKFKLAESSAIAACEATHGLALREPFSATSLLPLHTFQYSSRDVASGRHVLPNKLPPMRKEHLHTFNSIMVSYSYSFAVIYLDRGPRHSNSNTIDTCSIYCQAEHASIMALILFPPAKSKKIISVYSLRC